MNIHFYFSRIFYFFLYRPSQAIYQLLQPYGMKKRRDFGNGLLLGGQLGRCLYKLQLPDSGHPTSPPSQGRQPWPGTIARAPVLPAHPCPSRRATRVRVVFLIVLFCFLRGGIVGCAFVCATTLLLLKPKVIL